LDYICTVQNFNIITILSEKLLFYYQELPEKWNSMKKLAWTVKHELAPLHTEEVAVIRRKCLAFEVRSSLAEF